MSGATRVDRLVAAWAAMAAYTESTGNLPGTALRHTLAAQGATSDEIETARDLQRLEQNITVAGLQGRVEDLDAELEEAQAARHLTEVAAFGAAAVVFAHAAHPDAETVEAAKHAMTAGEWLVFESLTHPDPDETEEQDA